MFKLDISKLQKGDIILERYPEDRTSCMIMEKSGSNYSHALMYIGICSIIEAGDIVISNNPQYRFFKAKEDVCVLRLKPEWYSENAVEEVIKFLRSHIGTQYSTSEAFRILDSAESARYPNRQTCTRLVAQAYQEAGIPIVKNADYCTPNEIETSNRLERVEDVILPCTKEDESLAQQFSILEKQEDIISSILDQCNSIVGKDSDIQTFEQLAKATYEYPEKIDDILNIIISSGYFDLWKEDKETNPYDFDEGLFMKKYGEFAMEQASTTLHICEHQITLFLHNLLAHKLNLKINGDNPYICRMIQFYEDLINWSLERYTVSLNVYNKKTNEVAN